MIATWLGSERMSPGLLTVFTTTVPFGYVEPTFVLLA